MKNSNFYKEFFKIPKVLSVFGPTWPPIYLLKMTKIIIQMNQNRGPIFFQLSLKTVKTFCSIWAFFWIQMGQNFSRFGVVFYTFWHFFWLSTYFWINWISRSIRFAESFEKKKSLKKPNIQKACHTLRITDVAISSHIISFRLLNASR